MEGDRDVLGGKGTDGDAAPQGESRNPLASFVPVRGADGRVLDFRLTSANAPYLARLAPVAEPMGCLLSEITPPPWRDLLLATYSDAFEHARHASFEHRLEVDGRGHDYLFDLVPTSEGLVVGVDDLTDWKSTASELALTTSLLRGIARLQERFLAGDPFHAVLDDVVALAVEVTGSARGFIGKVRRGDEARVDVCAMHAAEWTDREHEHHRQRIARGGSVGCFEALWRAVLREGDSVFGGEPPAAHPIANEDGFRTTAYLGVPIRRHGTLVGVIGVANRSGGYDESWVLRLEPLVAAAGALFEAAHQATERELVEAELRRSESLLREAQELAGLGVYSYMLPDGPVRWTKQMRAMFDLANDVPAPSLGDWFALATEDHRQGLRDLYAEVTRDGVQRELEVAFVVHGVARHMHFVARGRIDDHARIVELHGTVKDVTERKQVESTRLRFEQQLAETQRLEALGLLAGGIAHDVNNLLVGVLANAQLIREDGTDDEQREAAAEIEVAARRMAELTRQILDYAGRSHASAQALDFNSLTSETVQLVRRTLPRTAKLSVVLAPQRLIVEVDAAQLRQVVMNLVINAGEALSGSPGEVVVTTSVEREANPPRALLEVRDTGVGMTEDVRRRIFDPFYTTKAKGRGLGLSAVHGIVRRFGGTIDVESVPLRGTAFRVALPLSNRRATPVHGMRPSTMRKRRLRVLVVDDEAIVRNAVRGMLERHDCEVLLADGGREALHHFATTKDYFDVVLLDVLMPYLSGADVLREIRRISPQQRVVMMSGFVERNEAATRSADGFLKKPFTATEIEVLLAAVDAKRATLG